MSQHPLRISLFDVLASPRAEARTESGFPDCHPHYFLLMQILKVCHSSWGRLGLTLAPDGMRDSEGEQPHLERLDGPRSVTRSR